MSSRRASSPPLPAPWSALRPTPDATPGGVAKGAYFYRPYPLTMERGDGPYLFDVDGNRYADFANHHTGQILGHRHPAVMAAIRAQLQRGIALGAPMGHETEACAELCSRVASLERARFTNSGTEASLHAVRLARAFTGRNRIAKFEGCYHGSHDSVEVSVAPPLEAAGPADRPLPYAQAIGMSAGAVADTMVLPLGNLEAAERLIAEHAAELACVMLDPKSGVLDLTGGLHPRRARDHRPARRADGLRRDRRLPAGTGRRPGVLRHHARPDHVREDRRRRLPGGRLRRARRHHGLLRSGGRERGIGQSGTFASHPVTLAAGLAMLRELTPAAFEHLAALGDRLTRGLGKALAACPVPASAHNNGSAFAIHFRAEPPRDYRSSLDTDKRWVSPLFLALLDRGFFLGHTLGMCSISVPTTPQMIDELVDAVADAVSDPLVKAAATDS